MARTFITFIKSSVIVITRAILRSIKEEIQESQLKAKRLKALKADERSANNLEITVEEAIQILDVKKHPLCKDEIKNRFQHLYKVNTHSLYLRSKVYRAYERLIKEFYKNHIKDEKIKPIGDKKFNKNTEIKCS